MAMVSVEQFEQALLLARKKALAATGDPRAGRFRLTLALRALFG